MRRFNFLFLFMLLAAVALYAIYNGLHRNTVNFYGVAENQETQINLEHASRIKTIYVTNGEFVSGGKLLMDVTRSDLDFKLNELNYEIEEIRAHDRLDRNAIQAELYQYRALKAEKMGDIQAQIRVLESERKLNDELFLDLKSIRASTVVDTTSVYATKLKTLQDEMRLAIKPLDVEIARLEKELQFISVPAETEASKLNKSIELYRKEQELLHVYAPSDGLVGSIHCRVGENIPSFNTLISFYEQSPNTVVGFVHESMTLKIHVGDSLMVQSTLHPEETCMGVVSGLGHRIVEIPERLRKIPEIKMYGREILVHIPSDNKFLQKEKVMLHHPESTSLSFLSLLFFVWHPFTAL
jgi:multidrug resistance efflux pump